MRGRKNAGQADKVKQRAMHKNCIQYNSVKNAAELVTELKRLCLKWAHRPCVVNTSNDKRNVTVWRQSVCLSRLFSNHNRAHGAYSL